MISILIPVFNRNCTQLVVQLQQQCEQTGLVYEIIVADDASTDLTIKNSNQRITDLNNVKYLEMPVNLGRSAIRNKLASLANQAYLLFIDDDMAIVDDEFIKRYANVMESDEVIYGGLVYPTYNSKKASLREKFGNEREIKTLAKRLMAPSNHISTCNLVVKRSVFEQNKFDESIKNYGWEDNLFAIQLAKKGIKIAHINNPLLHLGIENSEVFLTKTTTACQTLAHLAKNGNYTEELKQIKLYNSYLWLAKLYLSDLFCLLFSLIKNGVENHLKGPNPNLFFFDLYKLYQLTFAIKKANQ